MFLVAMHVAIASGLLCGIYPAVLANDMQGTQVTRGYYLYQSPPEEEGMDSKGQPGVIPFGKGYLTDGDLTKTGKAVNWKSRPTWASIVFDLTVDHKLDSITVVLGPNPKSWHAGASLALSSRAEAEPRLQTVDMQLMWPPEENGPRKLHFRLGGRPVRYVQIRLNMYAPANLQIREVVIHAVGDEPSPIPTKAASNAEYLLKVATQEPTFLDEYGQFIPGDWTGKIQSDEQLVQDAQREDQQLPKCRPTEFDTYGGILDGPSCPPTGFFQLKKIQGKWWFLTPEGNRFFLLGIDRMNHILRAAINDAKTGGPRTAFRKLPDRTAFPEAYADKDPEAYSAKKGFLDFMSVNLMRKYGPDWLESSLWHGIMERRLWEWGFNGSTRWGGGGRDAKLCVPYTLNIWMGSTWGKMGSARIDQAGGGGSIDPFDPRFPAELEAEQADWVRKFKDDPWVIGWIFENENGWKYPTFNRMLQRTDDCPAKRSFLGFLRKRQGGTWARLAKKLGVSAESLDALAKLPIDAEHIQPSDRNDFIRLASKRYHRIISTFLRKHDPNHLYLGSAWGTMGCREWIEGSIDYVDAFSFNCYVPDPFIHKEYDKYDKPRIITEVGFSVYGRGLGGWGLCKDHRIRGLTYRYLVEHLAANPCAVGIGWFQLKDNIADVGFQPVEYFNLGLINVCDQPYDELVREAKTANQRVYVIRSGQAEPLTKEELGLIKKQTKESHVIPGTE